MNTKANIDIARIAMLTHPRPVIDLMVRFVGAPIESFLAAWDALERDRLRDQVFSTIPVAAEVAGTEGDDAYRARVYEAAIGLANGQDRGDTETADARASGDGKMTRASEALAESRAALRDHEARENLRRLREPKSSDLAPKLWWRRFLQLAAGVVEGATAFGGGLAFAGVWDGPAGSTSPGQWLLGLGIGAAFVVAMVGSTFGLAAALDRIATGSRLAKIAAVLCTVGLIATDVGFGVVRWISSGGSGATTGDTDWAGQLAVIALLSIGSLALAVMVYVLEREIKALAKQHGDALGQEAFATGEVARIGKRIVELQAEVDAHTSDQLRPGQRRDAFRDGVRLASYRLRRAEESVDASRRQVSGTFSILSALSAPEQEVAIAEMYRIIDAPSDEQRRTESGGILATVRRMGIASLLLGISAAWLPACESAPLIPESRVLACDGTGAVPACNADLVKTQFESWAKQSIYLPESVFAVVMVGADYGDTRVTARFTVPSVLEDGVKVGGPRWVQARERELALIDIPKDEPGDHARRSDIASLLLVSSQIASEIPTGPTDLLIATDGWAAPAKAKRGFSNVARVVADLKEDGVTWDLRAFRTITVCGLATGPGVTPRADAQRKRFMRDLLASGGARPTATRSSCSGLAPSLIAVAPVQP